MMHLMLNGMEKNNYHQHIQRYRINYIKFQYQYYEEIMKYSLTRKTKPPSRGYERDAGIDIYVPDIT